jgi:NAD(P)-dependent dehydrogenase (short-subunit alcohol dehydrogenase family)
MALPERKITADGFEMQMGTNHFGHFYLTYLLWDKIRTTQGFRIINVSSGAHRGFGFPKKNLKIDFEDLPYNSNYSPGEAYGRSKAANILFTREL